MHNNRGLLQQQLLHAATGSYVYMSISPSNSLGGVQRPHVSGEQL